MISVVLNRVCCPREILGYLLYVVSLNACPLIEWCLGPLEHMPLHGVSLSYFVGDYLLLSCLYQLIKMLCRNFYS